MLDRLTKSMTTDSIRIEVNHKEPGGRGMLARNFGLLLILLLAWLLAFWPSFRDMAELWMRSGTFAHGMVVLPISAYLIWTRRGPLNAVAPQPAWSMMLPLVVAIVIWCAGVAFSIASVEHLAATAVLVLLVWLCVGHRFFRVIAFPMLFLFFMAPAGDFLVPTMMDYTAEFTVRALRLTGVPVFQEGLYFVVPNGRWSVVEACSGIRYLIASFMVGTLYAYLSYRSLTKRLMFVAVALLVPIVANWFRAYMIVLIGYLSNNELAVGVDHLIYGWVFFGVVIMLMFWIGNRWVDPDGVPQSITWTEGAGNSRTAVVPGMVVVVLLLATTAWAGAMVRPTNSEVQLSMSAPELAAGWSVDPDTQVFRPDYNGARGESGTVYRRGSDVVSLYVALYADQAPGHEMVAWSNQLRPERKTWRIVEEADDAMPIGPTNYARLIGPSGPLNIWHWYRIGEHVEGNDYLATLRIAWRRLNRGRDDGAHLVIAVPGDDKVAARELAVAFLEENRGRIGHAIDAVFEAKD